MQSQVIQIVRIWTTSAWSCNCLSTSMTFMPDCEGHSSAFQINYYCQMYYSMHWQIPLCYRDPEIRAKKNFLFHVLLLDFLWLYKLELAGLTFFSFWSVSFLLYLLFLVILVLLEELLSDQRAKLSVSRNHVFVLEVVCLDLTQGWYIQDRDQKL
jgi:hypothetical protein